MTNLSTDLFSNTRSTGMVINSFALTLKGETLAFNVVNASSFRSVTEIELSAIKACYYAVNNTIHVSKMERSIYAGACDASRPFVVGNHGAALFPESFQPWEADSDAFIEECNGTYSLTYVGEIAFDRFIIEAAKVLKRAC